MKKMVMAGIAGGVAGVVLTVGGLSVVGKAEADGGTCRVISGQHAGILEHHLNETITQGYSVKAAGWVEKDASMWALVCR